MADNDYEADARYDEDDRQYASRDRSRSPRGNGADSASRARSASPNGRDRYDSRDAAGGDRDRDREDGNNANPGSNLFVTGIAPRLSEQDVTEMFAKYGPVEKCNIMRDPHTGDSRGFGFVKMVTAEGADAARDALGGQQIEGRTLSIEKARRGRPRTPTPGKYYGPPKREGGGMRGGRGGPRRFDSYDRSRGDSYGRRDDYGGSRGYGRRDDYGGGRRDDRYGGDGYGSGSGGYGGGSRGYREDRGGEYSRRDDRYSGGGREERRGYSDDRRGYGGSGGYSREERGGYSDSAPRESREPYPSGGRN